MSSNNINIVIVLTIAAIFFSTMVDAAVCTAAQLKGKFSSFRLPGGGGTYEAGTNQVVSYNWPTGSKITSIKSVAICQGVSCQTPVSVSGLPINFVSTSPDQGGGINVQLPFSIASGSYVFRVTVHSGNVDCTVDSIPFTAVGGLVNGNECNLGDSLCFNSKFLAPCVQQGAGTQPNIWGFAFASECQNGCIQNGNKGTCVNNGGGQTCTAPQMRCTSSTTFQVCDNGAFTANMQCGAGTHCNPYPGAPNYIICQ